MDDLQERVEQFMMLRLPGQPMGMHMGTSYLVSDLWREVQQLRAAQLLRESVKDDTPKSALQTCSWTRNDDEESSSYDTECGSGYFFIDGDLYENEVKFCFHCGKPISA